MGYIVVAGNGFARLVLNSVNVIIWNRLPDVGYEPPCGYIDGVLGKNAVVTGDVK